MVHEVLYMVSTTVKRTECDLASQRKARELVSPKWKAGNGLQVSGMSFEGGPGAVSQHDGCVWARERAESIC